MKSDVVIVGGGPGGAASAMFLLREGIKPLIVEKETFPRYHIGESLTGAGGQLLRDLGLEDAMRKRRYPAKSGAKIFGQSKSGSWFVPVTGRNEHWELFDTDTWQVRRSDFDKLMLEEAVARGATLIRGNAIEPLRNDDGSVRGVRVRMADGGTENIASQVLLDCTGQSTWLANLGGVTGPKYLGAYDKQIAIFSQVSGAVRDQGGARENHGGNTLIFYRKKYHWAWFIPLDHDIVSVGVVVPAAYFLEKKESKTDFLKRELHQLHPELERRVPEIKLVDDVHVIPNYSYQVKGFCGKGFLAIGDAHRFIDPIFSFGVTMAMREAQFAAPAIRAYLEGAQRDLRNPFAGHQLRCEQGIDVLEDMLDAFWEYPLDFGLCVYRRFREQMTDLFAGRIYERQPLPAVQFFRRLLEREAERLNENEDLYSIPIGSRFHPERAPIWQANAVVESSEVWMGQR